MAKKRMKQKAVVVGTTGKGKSYSTECAIANKINMPEPPKNKKDKRDRLSINTKNISKFLNGLTSAEFIYLNHTVTTAMAIKSLFKEYDISIERFCKDMDIKKRQFDSYMKGSRNYDLKDISKLNALAYALYIENAEKNAEESIPIKMFRPKTTNK